MELNKQQEEEFLKTFMANIETAIKNLKSQKDKNTSEVLKEQGSSDKEKETIKDLCDEIDSFHQKKKELQKSKAKDPAYTEDEWLKEEIAYSANEVYKTKTNCDLSPKNQNIIRSGVEEELEKFINYSTSQITENRKK